MKVSLFYLIRDNELKEGPFFSVEEAYEAREDHYFTADKYEIVRQILEVEYEP